MKVTTISAKVATNRLSGNYFEKLQAEIVRQCPKHGTPLRVAVISSDKNELRCEIEFGEKDPGAELPPIASIFGYRQRQPERTGAFNAVMLIPTGVDCAIGGHAGDATPSARLLSSVCDHLILHPNVVNASDINEQPSNCLYVEGSVICRLMMGAVSLRKVRRNRILMVTESREDGNWAIDQVVNCASGARATLGIDCTKVVVLNQPLSMKMAISESGRAVGDIGGFEPLFRLLHKERRNYDAVALSTKITPAMNSVELHQKYFRGEGLNPWGGVEAALTHTVSLMFDKPSAHAPTMSDLKLRTESYGQIEPRKAAESISTSYLFCVLKGLHQSPAVLAGHDGSYDPSTIATEDVSALVIPDGCVGLPTLAALQQGIPVIAVRNNTNIMKNDLSNLPFAEGQLQYVENYFEAAGLLSAMRAGVCPSAVRRPMPATPVEFFG